MPPIIPAMRPSLAYLLGWMRCPDRLAVGREVSGTAAVEFVLILPILLAVLVATVDIGMAFYDRMQVDNAAQAGAEYAALKGSAGFDANAISQIVTGASSLSQISASPAPSLSCGCAETSGVAAAQCGSQCPDGLTAGKYATVAAEAQYSTFFPYPGLPRPMTLSAQSTVRLE